MLPDIETAHRARHPLEHLMRDLPRAVDPDTQRALEILQEQDPSDVFSRMQWSVGLPYFQQRLADWGLSGDACLDFGCGTGNWTIAASRVFGRVLGVDKHERRLRAAISIRDALAVRNVVFASDDAAMQVDSDQVDCILFYNVLPFIPDRRAAIQRLTRRLKPNGRIVVSFNEIGVWPYYFLNGVRYVQRSYMRKACVVPAYFVVHRFLRAESEFEATHGWLRTSAVVSFFHELGFDTCWTSWDAKGTRSALPLFPHRKFCLPFFREIVFRRFE